MVKRILYSLSVIILIASFVVPAQRVDASRTTRCGSINVLDTPGCKGYFTTNDYYNTSVGISGQNILYNTSDRSAWAIPSNIDTKPEFKSFIHSTLGTTSTYSYNKAGAAFIVTTMIGRSGDCKGDFCGTTNAIAYAQAHIGEWDLYLDHNNVNWNYATSLKAGDINSMHVCTNGTSPANCTLNGIIAGTHDAKDFSFFRIASSDGSEVSNEIRFYDPSSGALLYRLRRQCANLIGDTDGLDTPSNYVLRPTTKATIKDGSNTVPGNVAEVGNTVTFTYAVINSGDASDTVDCTVYANTHSGYYEAGTPEHGTVKSKAGCPRTFTGHTTTNLTTATETITIGNGDVNTTICRSLFVNPYQTGFGERGTEVCIVVAAKPYVKVFGGDVSAGNGISTGNNTTCTANNTASLNSWNRGSSQFLGSGTQFAAMALSTIDEFASAQNVGGVATPSGLAFSNTTGNGTYGGDFGQLPCIPDYYSQASGTTTVTSPIDPANLDGSYSASGSVTINGGAIPTGKRSVVYVDGDVYINGNISYASGTWAYNQIPFFELVVRGNIYIAPGVSRLDGAYIAQQKNGAKGTIYTCATSTGPYALDGTLFNNCNSKLTVNGLFSAYQVYLMRTYGTLSQSTTGETAAGSHAGEVFNYNPTMWIAQPPAGSTSSSSKLGDYDAITSLPPVL